MADEKIRHCLNGRANASIYRRDGYVVFEPGRAPMTCTRTIRQKLQFMVDEEFNYGNNVLPPAYPRWTRILNSPGSAGRAHQRTRPRGYIEHPHRFCHYISPDATHRTLAQNCHQDSYTPPWGRPRQHYPALLHASCTIRRIHPFEIGPTHAIPGTQYHRRLTDEDRQKRHSNSR